MGLWYSKDIGMSLTAYLDADHAGCQDTRRSTSGSAQFLGDRLVSWSSTKQKSTAISNYVFQFNKIPLYCDNKCAIALCCNNVQHSRAKHSNVRYHFIKGQMENGIMELYFVRTKYQLADILTKPLPRERFNFLVEKLGMRSISPKTLADRGRRRVMVDNSSVYHINMNPVAAQQVALNNTLVAPEKRLKIEKCNARIEFNKPQREETYQVTLDALKLCPCYPTFLITAEVPEVCLILPNQEFVEPPFEDELVSFIQELGASLGRQQDLIGLENQELKSCREKTISKRNKINLHIVRDDTLLATPKKARKFKKVASPSKKLSLVLEEEPAVKPKRAKKPAKKSTTVPTTALLEAAQLKKTLKKSKLVTHKLHASGSSDGVGVPDVPKYLSESENEFWGDSADDDSNDDDSDEVTKDDDDDDDDDSDANGDKEASDSEKTDSDEDENPNLNQNDDEEEEYEEEYVRTLDSIEFIKYDEEYEELYKDVNVRLNKTDHKEEGKGDEEMTDAGRDDGTQQNTYEQVKDDEHLILTTVHDTQKTEVPLQSSSVSSDIANQFLNLDNVPPTNTEVISMMNVKVRHEEPSTQTPPLLNIPIMAAPTLTPLPTTVTTIASIPDLPDFSSLFGFDQRGSALEKELSQFKQTDYSAQLLETIKSQNPAMVDAQLSTRLEDSIKKAFRSYTIEFEKKAKDERKRYIDLVEKFVKYIIKDEVKSQIP
ncbi:hypothetical protein Tco_0247224 [Tanacetum coccineum]